MYKTIAAIVIAIPLVLAIPVVDAAQRDHRQHRPIKTLPTGHHRVAHRGKSYFYSAGRFYRHTNGTYVVISAPIGAIVPSLPVGYISFGIGIRRHFYFAGVYYQQVNTGYEVVEEPAEAAQVLAQGSDKLIIYPAVGQTAEQRDQDRYECHVWAGEETNFDPTDERSDPMLKSDYNRALEACLEGRNYVVK